MYDAEWQLKKNRVTGEPVPRLNVPTPCSTCPRGSPENEAETKLTDKNWKAVEFVQLVRATSGAIVWGKQLDEVTGTILATVDGELRRMERQQLSDACAMGVVTAMSGLLGK